MANGGGLKSLKISLVILVALIVGLSVALGINMMRNNNGESEVDGGGYISVDDQIVDIDTEELNATLGGDLIVDENELAGMCDEYVDSTDAMGADVLIECAMMLMGNDEEKLHKDQAYAILLAANDMSPNSGAMGYLINAAVFYDDMEFIQKLQQRQRSMSNEE